MCPPPGVHGAGRLAQHRRQIVGDGPNLQPMVAGISRSAVANLVRQSPALVFGCSHAPDELFDVFVHMRSDFLNALDQPVPVDHALQIFPNGFVARQRDQRVQGVADEVRRALRAGCFSASSGDGSTYISFRVTGRSELRWESA